MLGWLVGSNYENGYYEQANKIVNLVVNVISSYTIVMRSRMSALFAQKRNEEIQEKMAVSYNVIAFLVFPMTFGIAAIAAGMVPWFFGDGYDAVIGLLYIFCPIFIFMGYSRMIGTHILTPSGRQQHSNYAQIIAAVVNITLNSLLIPRFFAKGAAVASVTAELVLVLVYYYMVRKEILLKQVIEMGWKKAIAAGIMFVFVFTIGKNFSISIHDAIEAGFNHVVFIIRKDIEKEFKEVIGDRIASICASHDVTVDYAFQDINDIPGALPEGRTKPWGTGQAVLAAKKAIKTPFIVINADDYYGKEGFKAVHDYLVNGGKSCMAGFVLKNTLSDNGGVTRGICKMDAENNLTEVVETKNIEYTRKYVPRL